MRTSLLLIFITTALPAFADAPQDCRTLGEDTARLACYDELFGTPESLITETGVAPTAEPETATAAPDTQQVSEMKIRLNSEEQLADNRFVITPHRQTYILPYTYLQDPNTKPYQNIAAALEDQGLDNEEIKFQISFKIPLYDDFLVKGSTLWAGYTQVSLWQAYNDDASAPFRETNYEPEIFWSLPVEANVFGATLEEVSLGVGHQSNGRSSDLSRSWNRAFASFVLARHRWAFGLKTWYRIPEDETQDDNPDIEKYLGYADFIGTYKWGDNVFSAQIRNNFRSKDNHTSTTLSLSIPFPGRINGYIEYVDGYGETLIDYNHRNQRIGIGFILNDWF
ncbi:phospholipase A [Aestuariicella hydrocarbonica]|uniref:Phospholipase A1 n=1 Tax=Pseudomaricurvus hydrocarbonicus TaxID=1470433 RepID=A0A9E5MNP3_9GAMM|nr:phospholipase A [Aestuariicella hydrocarbonica]NHO67611.1 phospholipase A [Aestuariicella hydrocarbonica]